MAHLLIGALGMGVFFWALNVAKAKELTLNVWQWVVTVAGILYGVLTLEVIVGFLAEGAPQAAAVMGALLAVVAVVWAVLLVRFVFRSPAAKTEAAEG